jgi:hypothetical protein
MHDVMSWVYVWLIRFDVAFDDFFFVCNSLTLSVVKSKKTHTQTISPGTFTWAGCSRLGEMDAAAAARTQNMLLDGRVYK